MYVCIWVYVCHSMCVEVREATCRRHFYLPCGFSSGHQACTAKVSCLPSYDIFVRVCTVFWSYSPPLPFLVPSTMHVHTWMCVGDIMILIRIAYKSMGEWLMQECKLAYIYSNTRSHQAPMYRVNHHKFWWARAHIGKPSASHCVWPLPLICILSPIDSLGSFWNRKSGNWSWASPPSLLAPPPPEYWGYRCGQPYCTS